MPIWKLTVEVPEVGLAPPLKVRLPAADPPIITVRPLSAASFSDPWSVTAPESILMPPKPPVIVDAELKMSSPAPCFTTVPLPEIEPVSFTPWSVPRLNVLVPDIVTAEESVSCSVVPETAVVVMVAPLSSVMLFVDVLPTVNADVWPTEPLLLNRMESMFTTPTLLLLVVFVGVPE